MFEIKEGPYIPATALDVLSQFPAEGTATAAQQVDAWTLIFSG